MATKKQTKKSNVQRVRSIKTKAPAAKKTNTSKKKCTKSTKKTNNSKATNTKDYVLVTPQGNIILVGKQRTL